RRHPHHEQEWVTGPVPHSWIVTRQLDYAEGPGERGPGGQSSDSPDPEGADRAPRCRIGHWLRARSLPDTATRSAMMSAQHPSDATIQPIVVDPGAGRCIQDGPMLMRV